MITLQHTALSIMAMDELGQNEISGEKIPWILLPDAIRMYVGSRQASHFEASPDGTDISWMEFPTWEILQHLSKENVKELVKYYVSPKAPKCVIGEQTDIDEFDVKNYWHSNYHEIRTHILQDCCLDKFLREELVDVTGRFEDKFVVRHNRSITLDGAELRKQIASFEEIGFLHLAGKVYKRCRIILNQEWFEENVHKVLLESDYPGELAENTYRFMNIPDEINQRINNQDFDLTDEDKAKVVITDNLERVLDELYAMAYNYTVRELVL